MSAFLLYHKKTRPTGRAIAEALGIPHGTNPNDIPRGTDKVIRWGNAKTVPFAIEQVNPARAIMLAGDKLETLRTLQAAGVACLEFRDRPPEELGRTIWFGRKRRGFGGKDIIAFSADGVWTPHHILDGGLLRWDDERAVRKIGACELFTRYVDNSREYRIHVVNGEVIRYQRKYRKEHHVVIDDNYVRVQNHSNGYVFRQPQRALRPERYDTSIAAVEALGLNFGAVDMVIDDNVGPNGVSRILEVNTAASCAPKTLSAYVEAFRKELAA